MYIYIYVYIYIYLWLFSALCVGSWHLEALTPQLWNASKYIQVSLWSASIVVVPKAKRHDTFEYGIVARVNVGWCFGVWNCSVYERFVLFLGRGIVRCTNVLCCFLVWNCSVYERFVLFWGGNCSVYERFVRFWASGRPRWNGGLRVKKAEKPLRG